MAGKTKANSKIIRPNKVDGCYKHGTTKGSVIGLNTKSIPPVHLPAYKCELCKKIYIDVDGLEKGSRHSSINGYSVENIDSPVFYDGTIYLYDKTSKEGSCSCNGAFNAKTRIISGIILPTGNTIQLQGGRQCNKCKKVFISKGNYKSNERFFIEKGIKVDSLIDKATVETINSKVSDYDDTEHCNSNKLSLDDYELDYINNIYEEDEKQDEVLCDCNELEQINKVASAYYNARIDYNPYQYLPWLKMYIEGKTKLLISDEVGLGKTIEAGILIEEELAEDISKRILVICPAFIKEKWQDELSTRFMIDAPIYDKKLLNYQETNVTILIVSV